MQWHKIEDEKPIEDGLYLWQDADGKLGVFEGSYYDLIKMRYLHRWYGPVEQPSNPWTEDYPYQGVIARGKIRTALADGKPWDDHWYVKAWYPQVDKTEQIALIEHAATWTALWKDA